MAATYYEFIDDRSPSQAGFSLEGGKASMVFVCEAANLEDSCRDLLGGVEAGDTAALKRTLPRAHPRFPWLFADSIASIVGVSPSEDVDADPLLEAEPVSSYTDYLHYFLNVSFSPRPYAVLGDDAIETAYLDYTDPTGTAQEKQYAPEWIRFTDWFYEPGLDIVQGLQGSMKIRGNTGTAPDGITANAVPVIRVPKTMVKAVWYYVPYSYIQHEDSYLRSFVGRINQFDWAGFPAGSLLYHGCTITRHTPIFPEMVPGINGYTVPSLDKLCTVELVFEHTERQMPSGITPTAPASTNYIQAGHNLAPWFGDRKFYYISTTDNASDTDNAKRYPAHYSEPFELLFSNPAVA